MAQRKRTRARAHAGVRARSEQPSTPSRGRDGILSVARRVFAEKGFTGATTADIARRAKVTQPLVHHHFGSKVGLWNAVLETLFTELRQALDTAVLEAAGRSRRDRLVHILSAFVRFTGRSPELSNLIRTEGSGGGQSFTETFETWLKIPLEFFSRELEAGVADNVLRPLDRRFLYFMVVGAATQMFSEPRIARHAFGLDVTDPRVIDLYAAQVADLILEGCRVR